MRGLALVTLAKTENDQVNKGELARVATTKDLGDREALISNMEIANSCMYNRPQGHCEHKIALTLFYLTPKEINYVKKRINQSKGKNGN